MHSRYLALRTLRGGESSARVRIVCLTSRKFSFAAPTQAGFSRSNSAELERALLSWCNGGPLVPVVSHGFELSRTESTGFFDPENHEARCCSTLSDHDSSCGQYSPVISECCSEAATVVGGSDSAACLPEEELSSAENTAKVTGSLRSASRIFNVSAGRDGGCFDIRTAYVATAILRLSSGSVLFTR